MIKTYDIELDEEREVTQEDFDNMQRLCEINGLSRLIISRCFAPYPDRQKVLDGLRKLHKELAGMDVH